MQNHQAKFLSSCFLLGQLGKGPSSLSNLEKDIQGINQKMLLEQLKELSAFGVVGKNSFKGYPLKVEYFLTERGKKMLEAVSIMQGVGIDIMLENGMEEVLRKKELLNGNDYPQKSG